VSETAGQRARQIAAEFAELEPRERLELLLEFSEKLAPLPEEFRALRDAGMNRIHECQTPVFLFVTNDNGRVHVHADVAPEAPTVKGFVSVLCDILNDATPAEVLTMDGDLVRQLGLVEALGMQRMRGLHAISEYVRRKVRGAIDASRE
jgi:cysteine desulfuration protein SufE